MGLLLFVLFLVVPLVEMIVLSQVAAVIGWPLSILLVVGDSLLGAWLLRREGRRAWVDVNRALAEARWPGDQVLHGAMVLVGGALLLTPGFMTDVLGLALLVPSTRRLLAPVVRSRATPRPMGTIFVGGLTARDGSGDDGRGDRPQQRPSRPGVYDAEVVSVEREQPPELA